jgi:hypothetical protein
MLIGLLYTELTWCHCLVGAAFFFEETVGDALSWAMAGACLSVARPWRFQSLEQAFDACFCEILH